MKKLGFFCSLFFIMLSMKISAQGIVIAHRGASAYLPEHTLETKSIAYAMGVDFIEQDIVLTEDGIPIVNHDLYLNYTTNVKEIFPRKKRKDGKYYVIDFTWKELQNLKVTERRAEGSNKLKYPRRFPLGKSAFGLHTLAEEIEMIQGLNKSMDKDVGLYVEIKDPKFHKEEKKDISKIVLEVLSEYGYDGSDANCYIQSYDAEELQRIRNELKSSLRLVQLYEPGHKDEYFKDKTVSEVIAEVSEYAYAIGPWYQHITNEKHIDVEGIEELVTIAHENDLKVHTYTLRADNTGTIFTFDEILNKLFNQLGVDGVFTDHPDKVINFIKKNQ